MQFADLLIVLFTGAMLGVAGTVLFGGVVEIVQDYLDDRRLRKFDEACPVGKPYDWAEEAEYKGDNYVK